MSAMHSLAACTVMFSILAFANNIEILKLEEQQIEVFDLGSR